MATQTPQPTPDATHMSSMEGTLFTVLMVVLASLAIGLIIYAHKKRMAKDARPVVLNADALEKLESEYVFIDRPYETYAINEISVDTVDQTSVCESDMEVPIE